MKIEDLEEEKDKIRKELEGVDLIFLLAGLGGGVGGGAAPVVARLAREHGALVFAFTPLPFTFTTKTAACIRLNREILCMFSTMRMIHMMWRLKFPQQRAPEISYSGLE